MRVPPLAWSSLRLFFRLASAWYLVLVLLTTMTAGFEAGFMGGLLLFPYAAILVAVVGTSLQVRARIPGTADLSAFHHLRLQVPWTRGEAEAELRAILGEDLGATALEVQGTRLQAHFGPPAWAGTWRRWLDADEVVVDLPASGEEGMEVWARPTFRPWYRSLWVDRGRNLRRLARFQSMVAVRLAASRRTLEAEHRAEAQAARLAQAELLLLRAQVEPHFLFNTLAHLRELVRTGDLTGALAMVDALATHARAATERIRQVQHPLGEEAKACETYLILMKLRFGPRLDHVLGIPRELQGLEVPVGSLLIPVENAVKHGLEPKRGGGTVWVRAFREEEHLVLEVLDDGLGLPSEPSSGTGLANLRQRLALAHPGRATLSVEDRPEGGVHVCIRLPLPQT